MSKSDHDIKTTTETDLTEIKTKSPQSDIDMDEAFIENALNTEEMDKAFKEMEDALENSKIDIDVDIDLDNIDKTDTLKVAESSYSKPMPALNKSGYNLPKILGDLIDAYNRKEATDLEKLFYLQHINYFLKGSTNPQIISWRNQLGNESLEAHLQHYGVHRDGSELQQSIEFAHAVKYFN